MIQSPCWRAIFSVSAISSRVATKAVGLAGELRKMTRVAGGTAAASLSGSRHHRPARSKGTERARDFQRAHEIGPGGRRDQRFVTGTGDKEARDLDRVHASDGDEEALGRIGPAAWRRPIDARHVGGDRLAQFRHAALGRVEGLAAVERRLGRLRRPRAAGRSPSPTHKGMSSCRPRP